MSAASDKSISATTRRRLSHVRRPLGPVDWYLEADHLLAADQRGFQVQYRRFYFSDIRSVIIWPNHNLWVRLGIEAGIAGLFAWMFRLLHAYNAAGVTVALVAAVMLVELGLGHRASARIETEHSTYTAPLVGRWRRAERVLGQLARHVPAATPSAVEVTTE